MLTNIFITDIVTMTAKNYNKFFDKIRKASLLRKDLLKVIFSDYYNYINI